MRETNYLHCSGKTLGNPPSDGQDFFVTINSKYPLQMGNIKLNDNFEKLDNIVASESGRKGDNAIAIKIADLRHIPVLSDTNGVMGTDDYYQSTMLAIGTGGAEAERIYGNQKTLVESADAQRKAVMSVSIDKKYQI